MLKPEQIDTILKLIEESNFHFLKSIQLQNNANIALVDLIKDVDFSVNKNIQLITAPDNGDFLNVRELSLLLKVSEATVYNWVNLNKVPFHKPENGKVYFIKYELTRLIDRYTKKNQ